MNAHTPAPLPNVIEAEQALLGAILENSAALGSVMPFLDAADFHEPLHREIYAVLTQMMRSGQPITIQTVKPFLPEAQLPEGQSTWEYVVHLLSATPGPAMAEGYGNAIRDAAVRRRLVAIGEDMATWARNAGPQDSPALQIADAEARLYEITKGLNRGNHRSVRYAGQIADEIMDGLDHPERMVPPVSTGLVDLDRLIGGYRRGNLIILAGRPGMMKTGFALSSSLNVAGNGRCVLFFGMDMPAHEMVARQLTDLAWTQTEPVAYKDVLDGKVDSPRHRELLADARRRLKGLPIAINPHQGLTIAEIMIHARRWADQQARKQRELGLIAIDHLGKIRAATRSDSRHLELGEYTNALVDLAGELGVPVLLLCQLNRGVEARERKDRRPRLADLRESGRIEEDAAVVIGLYREAYYLAKEREEDAEKELRRTERLADVVHDMDAIVLKNRHGAEGQARLWVHVPAGAVRNREVRE